MSVVRKFALAIFGAAIVLLLAVFWLIGTESGTRLILARAPLPAELELDEVSGTLLRGLRARSLTWNSEDLYVRVENLRADVEIARLLGKHVRLSSLGADAIDVRFAPSEPADEPGMLPDIRLPLTVSVASSSLHDIRLQIGSFEREIDALSVSGAMRGSQLQGVAVSLRSNWLNADLEGRLRTSGAWPADLRLQWDWTDDAAGRFDGRLELRGDRTRYAVQHRLRTPLALQSVGQVAYIDDEFRFDLENNWETLDWERGGTRIQSPTGTLHLDGTLESADFVLKTELGLNDLPMTTIAGQGVVDATGARVASLDLANAIGQMATAGLVTWTPVPGFDITYDISGVDPSAGYEELRGTLGGSGAARGQLIDGELEVDVRVASLSGDINGHALAGSGDLAWSRESLRLRQAQIEIGDNKLRAEGSIGDELALTAEAELADVTAIVPEASGVLSASLAITGQRNRPSVQVRGSGNNLSWSDMVADRLEFDGSGTLDRHSARVSLVAGRGNVDVEVRGGLVEREWSGDITRLGITQPLAGEWRLLEDTPVVAGADRVEVRNLCLQRVAEAGKACMTLDIVPAGATNFDLIVETIPLAALPWTLPVGTTVSGFADARASGILADQRLTGELIIDLNEARIDTEVDDELISAVFERADGRITVTDNALDARLQVDLEQALGTTSLELAVADVFEPTSTLAGEGNVAIDDLSLISVFVPDVANPRGVLSGQLVIGGTLAEPEFTGDLAVTEASFGIRRAGIEITDASMRLAQSEPGRLKFDGRASSGRGHITIEGDTFVSTSTGVRSEIRLRGQDFELLRLPDWQVAASPDIIAIFDDRMTNITGELTIPSADIQARERPQTATSASPDAVVHREDREETSDKRRIDIDVNAVLGDNVKIAAFGLTTGLTGAVQLRGGSHDAFKGYGRLSLVGGRYKAYGQDLDIERGELIFNGPLDNPQLDVRAIRRTTDVVAGIQLAGTPQRLRSTVFSEPALSESEALSYLLTGRPLASASGSDDGDMLNAAAFALGVSSAGSIVSQVRSGLGLETLAIEGGPSDGRLIAGKRFGDRLLVEYGYGLVDKMGTLLLRYRLNKRVTLESRTGEVSNFDIVYSVKKQ